MKKPTLTPSRHALAWLKREPLLAALSEQAARLASLQDALDRCAPGLTLTVLALDGETLVVGVGHAALAARIRQTTPSLIEGLMRRGWPIRALRIRARWRPDPPPPPRTVRTPPGPAAIASVRALSAEIATPALKAALERLAARHEAASRR